MTGFIRLSHSTVYYGEKQWDGPYCLKDMIVEMPEEIAAIFSDYKMNLLEVRDSGKYIFNNTDVQSVFEITRETFAGHFDAIREKYGDKQGGGQYVYGAGKVNRRWKKEGMQEGRLTSVKNLMGEYGMEGRAGDGCIENLTRRQE